MNRLIISNKSNSKKQVYNKKDFNNKNWNPKGGKYHKTHENFHPKHNQYNKDRKHVYENRKERGDDPRYGQKNHYKNNHRDSKRKPQKHNEETKEPERGEECKKPVISDQRKREHKALFANQLMSIKKTLTQDKPLNKDKDKRAPPKPFPAATKEVMPGQKSTALAGRDFVHSKDKDNFKYKEKQVWPQEVKKEPADASKPYGRSKRGNNGFKVHAEAMFSQQNGGTSDFTDFT